MEPAAPILVVEDDVDVREAVQLWLEHKGYSVVTAADGSEASRLLDEGLNPCLILLDLMMPKMDGFGFRREQLADPVKASIPVVLFSGMYDARMQCMVLGTAGYLQKPVDPDRLLTLVAQHRRR
jgi:two-component system chemotaxis response regulator CheY